MYISWFHKREIKKADELNDAATDEHLRTVEADVHYFEQKKIKTQSVLSKSVAGVKNGASFLEWTNIMLTVMVILPVVDWETYKYLWVRAHFWINIITRRFVLALYAATSCDRWCFKKVPMVLHV